MKIYIDLFITGVSLSWGPCFSFCAPVLLPYIAGTQKGWRNGLKLSLVFSLARIVPYVILSLISAGLGQYLIRMFYQAKGSLLIQICTGVFIVILGLVVVMGKSTHPGLCTPFLKKLTPQKGIWQVLVLGLLIGAAPCLPLFGVLLYIAFNATCLMQGAFLGLAFGLGTLVSPVIFFGPLVAGLPRLLEKEPRLYKIFSLACGLILIYLGISVLWGAGHLFYTSP